MNENVSLFVIKSFFKHQASFDIVLPKQFWILTVYLLILLDVFSVTAASAIKGAISYLALPDFILCSFITLYIWNVVNIYVFNLPAFKSSLSMLFIDASKYTKWINLKCILCGSRGASRVLKGQVNWANPNSKTGTIMFKIFVWRAYFDIKQGH